MLRVALLLAVATARPKQPIRDYLRPPLVKDSQRLREAAFRRCDGRETEGVVVLSQIIHTELNNGILDVRQRATQCVGSATRA